mmetsp:Transcript_58749/g.170441  ORF Transcript_58749/g.170441 Transcript_58749/m.170441 type:complete len:310 (-) Transcript_58749:154-1083(-)
MAAMSCDQDSASRGALGKLEERFWGCSKVGHHVDTDDLPSTAAPSVMHSPDCGPEGLPEDAEHFDEHFLGLVLTPLPLAGRVSIAEEHTHELRKEIEHHLAAENLCKDLYLRSRMDGQGWVPLDKLAELAALRCLDATAQDAAAAARLSPVLEVSGDGRRVRCADPALRSAFPATHGSDVLERSPSPQVSIADEDLTVAAMLAPESPPAPRRASKEGDPWPCTEWLTTEPDVAEPCLDWLLAAPDDSNLKSLRSRRHRHSGRRAGARRAFRAEEAAFEGPEVAGSPGGAAWLRLSDDGYPTAAASLLQW